MLPSLNNLTTSQLAIAENAQRKSLFKNVVSFWTRRLFCCSDEKSGIIYASLTADLHMTLKCQTHIKKTQLIKQYDPGRLTKLTVFEWTYANS